MLRRPSEYPRRILLAVSGLTPQIVTETLYALALQQTEPYIPSEIHLLSTQEGAARAKLLLLSEHPGWFHRICREYELSGIHFPESNIHVISDKSGYPLQDIRTAEDNRCAADFITEHLRKLTSDAESSLHVSLAGGRKTLGFYAGYALSLFGRPQDRLSHVLAPTDYEFSTDFFYPTRRREVIEGKDKKPLDASEASLTLAEIPFVRMRHGLPENLLCGSSSFSEVVRAANQTMGPAELTIDQRSCKIRAAGKVFQMRRAAVAMLSVFARRALKGDGPLAAPSKGVEDHDWSRMYFRELRRCVDDEGDLNRLTLDSLERGMDGDQFSMQLSRLQSTLRKALGPAATPYLIDNGGTRPGKFHCKLPSSSIHFVPIAEPSADQARRERPESLDTER